MVFKPFKHSSNLSNIFKLQRYVQTFQTFKGRENPWNLFATCSERSGAGSCFVKIWIVFERLERQEFKHEILRAIVSPLKVVRCSPHYLQSFLQPFQKLFSMSLREEAFIGQLDPGKGNLWSSIYKSMSSHGKRYWAYAHHYSVQNPLKPTEHYSWDHYVDDCLNKDLDELPWTPPKDFDERFCYYSENVPLTMELSHDDLAETTDAQEYEKCNAYRMPEMVSLEIRLIPKDSLLGNRGKKKQAEEEGQERPKGSKRGSSVPPHSDTAKARAQA